MKSILMTTAALAALSGAAYGQTADPAAPVDVDAVIVTGYRSSNAAAIAAKREATGVVDVVSQDEVGLLPDLTISEIARRIPGVTVISQGGPEGVRSVNAEPNVVIRGLNPSFNMTTFDGAPIASTDEDERAANLGIIPPTFVSRVEAVKTLTADLNPHGLSGQINLATTSAFDRGGSYFASRFSIGANSTSGEGLEDRKPNIRSSVTYSTLFGADERFGLVLGASYDEFYDSSLDLRPGAANNTYLFYEANPASNRTVNSFDASNGFPAARRPQLYLFDGSRKRASGVAKLEYAPNDRTYASLFLGAFHQDESEVRHEYLAAANNAVRPDNQTAFTGDWRQASVQAGYVSQPEESLTTVLTGRFQHRFENDGELKALASVSRAKVDVTRNMSKFLIMPTYTDEARFSYDLSSGQPVLHFHNPDFVNDLSLWRADYIRERDEHSRQGLAYVDVSYAQNFDRADMGFGYEVGAAYTRSKQRYDRNAFEGDVYDAAGDPIGFTGFVEDLILPAYGSKSNFYLIDDAALRAEWIAQGKTLTDDQTDNSVQDDYDLVEQIFGLYGLARYRGERFLVTAGLRYDSTKADVNVFARDDALVPGHVQDSDYFVPFSRSNDYAFWLPSVIGTYELTDNLLVKAGYGRTIGRPNFSQLATQERIREPNLAEGTITIARGNPDLKPLQSDNYDVSLEYYFDRGRSLISLAGFYKDVKDLIYTQTVTDPNYQHDGQTLLATITQPVNTVSSSIYGVELGVRKDFEGSLPAPFDGFVFDGNLTWIGSEFTFVNAEGEPRRLKGWDNQPEFLANFALSYETGPFGAKVAYNYVGDFLSKTLADEGDLYNMYREARGVWDLQVRYKVNDSLRVVGEVQNLTEEGVRYRRNFPSTGDLLAAEVQRGRVVWLGLRWSPSLR